MLAKNLKALMKDSDLTPEKLSKECGGTPSGRMVSYILKSERVPSVQVAEALAHAFGIEGWQLLLPSLEIKLARDNKLSKLIQNYSSSSPEGRNYIDKIAEYEAARRGEHKGC